MFFRQLLDRNRQREAFLLRDLRQQLRVPALGVVRRAGPRQNAAVGDREVHVEQRADIHFLDETQTITRRASAVRRVERKRVRLDLGKRLSGRRIDELLGEEHVLPLAVRLDDVDQQLALAVLEGELHRVGQALLERFVLMRAGLDAQAVDDQLDVVLHVAVELDLLLELVHLTVHAGAHETLLQVPLEQVFVGALAVLHQRREQQDADFRGGVLRGRKRRDGVHDFLHGLAAQTLSGGGTARMAHAREQQAQVVVDLRDGAHGRTRVVARAFLVDGNRGRKAFDQIDIGLLHHAQELPGIGGQRLHVPPLSFRVDGVEGERRLSRTRKPGDDDELVLGDVDVHVLEVVGAGAAHADDAVVGEGRRNRDGLRRDPRCRCRDG